eukprot:362939-Chlamydomonas_euryale.AAC.5
MPQQPPPPATRPPPAGMPCGRRHQQAWHAGAAPSKMPCGRRHPQACDAGAATSRHAVRAMGDAQLPGAAATGDAATLCASHQPCTQPARHACKLQLTPALMPTPDMVLQRDAAECDGFNCRGSTR